MPVRHLNLTIFELWKLTKPQNRLKTTCPKETTKPWYDNGIWSVLIPILPPTHPQLSGMIVIDSLTANGEDWPILELHLKHSQWHSQNFL